MDFKRLSTFAAVAGHGTVLKAARVLRITQPALSRQIAGLEQDLGFKLFDRVGRRLLLTPRGEQFLAECRHLLAEASALSERAKELRRGDIKVLRVAASSEPVEALFPTFLHRYAQRYPDVQLVVVEADAADHLGMLERGEVHLAAAVINVLQLNFEPVRKLPTAAFLRRGRVRPGARASEGGDDRYSPGIGAPASAAATDICNAHPVRCRMPACGREARDLYRERVGARTPRLGRATARRGDRAFHCACGRPGAANDARDAQA